MPDFFPVQHRHAVKSFYLFGFPVTGRKTIEYETFEKFKSASRTDLYPTDHARRKAYLDIVRGTPLYGCAALELLDLDFSLVFITFDYIG